MAPITVEDDFMNALFQDLDATTFDTLPSSPPRPSQSRLSQKRQPSQSSPQKRPPLPPPKPSPFWKKGGGTTIFPSQHDPSSSPLGGMLKPKLGLSPVKRATKVRHVEIVIGGKENALKDLKPKGKIDLKGKGKEVEKVEVEEVDFDALCGGMDWEEDEDSPVKERVATIPNGKRFTRCTVESVVDKETNVGPYKQVIKELLVRMTDGTRLYTVWLCDDWVETPIELGDTINLIGTLNLLRTPSLTIDRNANLLILHPDILVSSTKVADSSHCSRKALLQEIIRSSGGSTPALVYGNMLHELMQACFVEEKWDDEFKEKVVDKILKENLGVLWGMKLEVDDAKIRMMEKSEAFEEFKKSFLDGNLGPISDPHAKDTSGSKLSISETLEIEEDIWSPKYGLKGKVDVTVSGKISGEGGKGGTLPFEIKTGKANMGMEHRAQTMLYTLLMSDRYDEEIDSGLLYYTQPNQVFRVTAARNEIRSLIISRNEFATYHHRRTTLSDYSNLLSTDLEESDEKKIDKKKRDHDEEETPLLPPPIDEARSCKWCYVSDACMLYRKAVEGEDRIDDDDGDALQMQFEDKTGHLTREQSEFFRKWEKLISLEEQELVRFKKEIWTMCAEERMKLGRCMANMSIDPNFVPPPNLTGTKIHHYTYRLQHSRPLSSQATSTQQASRSLLGGSISINDPIVVSLENPSVLAISRGFVLSVSAHDVVIGVDHSLIDNPQALRHLPRAEPWEFVFRIDRDELAAGLGRIRDNLIQLFVVNGDEKRRKLVVDLDKPRFRKCTGSDLVSKNLNEDQTEAVRKVLLAEDYALILGMPGTGKTTTIAHILKALVKSGKSVLLTSYTHSAVDNILLKVKDKEGMNILRLGNRDKIMPELHKFTLGPDDKATTLEDLDRQFLEPQIVATTCLSINEPLFTRRRFDVCIVDEASQVTLPTCLGPLRFADSFILVGDHNQLPPLVRNRDARDGGLDVSLFKRLSDAHPQAVVYLSRQYRMNNDIMHLSNKLVYGDRLTAGSEEVANQVLKIPYPEVLETLHKKSGHEGECWIKEILSDERKVIFVDTDVLPARERKIGPLVDNETEAKLVLQTVDALVRCGVPQTKIGVIAFYRQQIKLLSRQLYPYPQIEVLTADKSQGRDKDCIVMSLTRSNTEGQIGDLLKDWRRINVCLTRAKSKLIVFGSRPTLSHADILAQFFEVVEAKGWIYNLPAGSAEAHDGLVKRALESSSPVQEKKKVRVGPEKLVLSQPLVRDVVNSL